MGKDLETGNPIRNSAHQQHPQSLPTVDSRSDPFIRQVGREDSRTPSLAFFLHKHSIGTDVLLCDDECRWKHYFNLKDQWRHRSQMNLLHWTDKFCSHDLTTLKEWKVELFGNIYRISFLNLGAQIFPQVWKFAACLSFFFIIIYFRLC